MNLYLLLTLYIIQNECKKNILPFPLMDIDHIANSLNDQEEMNKKKL